MNSGSHHIGPDSTPDRYRLLNSIGRGGEAVLYRAEIELDGAPETVVVKVLDSRTTISVEQFRRLSARWQDQAELLRFVNRPGVVGVREHFEGPPIHGRGDASTAAGRSLVLVMNHVEGLDLRDWREERTLATHAERREVLRTLEQLADVLDWLHSGRATPSGRSVVHGDLSPGNVMVDRHGQATLVDFGLSKLTADHRTAEVWFTPGYAAPEVFEGKRTPNTDRYAFGAIAYFLLSAQSPPSTPEQLRTALAALPQVAAADPDRIERILRICAVEPDRRPESLSAWMKDLRPAVVSTTVTGAPAVPVRDAVPGTAGTTDTAPGSTVTPAVPPPPLTPPPGSPPAASPDKGAPPAFPPPITASADPGVPLPATVDPGPATGPDPARGAGPGPRPHDAPPASPQAPAQPPHDIRPPHSTQPPRPFQDPTQETQVPAAPQRNGSRKRIALSAAAVLVAAALGAGGAWALLRGEDGDRPADAVGASAPADADPGPDASPDDSGGTDDEGDGPSPDPSTPGVADNATEVSLTTLNPVADTDGFEVGSANLNTQLHTDAYVASPDCTTEPYMEFNLGRAWTTFDLTAGIDDDSYYESGRLTVKVDDTTLWVGTLELGKPQRLSLKVANGLRLRIQVDENCDGAKLALGTPLLKR
ncbi:protein kinase [Streptomyces sp. NPDC014744]|uniref:protein kinase domain-containing protein n=1 Tax=Streptomyces sp. NPDC014744 TaxID=3364903 RepID=UPI003700D218